MTTIRTLPSEEWPLLGDIFIEHGGGLPDPSLARILVAEDDHTLLGFLVIQLQPHLEPIWVAPAHRGSGVSVALALAARSQFPTGTHFYAFASTPLIEALATKAGLVKLPWTVFKGTGD